MNDPKEPNGPPPPAEKPPTPPTPEDYGLTEEDLRDTISFDFTPKPHSQGGSGPLRLNKITDPISGGSVVSWADLLRQQQLKRISDAEVTLGSLPEIQIDSISDKDIVKNLASGVRPAPAVP